MARPDSARRLIVNADDLGRSASINTAIIQAHHEGILTSASLMVNEPEAGRAVQLAKANPSLGVGLHLVLIMGRAALSQSALSGLVDAQGYFGTDPVKLGFNYFFQRRLREPLRREIEAQFQKFAATGLKMDHVNGHMHLHMQPVIFGILMENAQRWGIRHFRLTNEPLRPNLRAVSGRFFQRALHSWIFAVLSARQRRALQQRGIRFTDAVFGQLQDAHVDEAYVLGLLPQLTPGTYELYSHPSLDTFKHELDALVSPRVRTLVDQLRIQTIRYQDL
ncbi:MAG: hopanoid biosynthesis-associated protein HpnK [Verrucomicrobiota bacterium]